MFACSQVRALAAMAFAAVVTIPVPASAEEPPAPTGTQDAVKAQPLARRSPRPGDITKVFVLQHAGSRALAEVLQIFPASITYATYGPLPKQAIGVSAAPGVMAAIEETIKRLDDPRGVTVPTKSIEITGYVLDALSEPAQAGALPPELEGVVTQLRRTFAYTDYRLVDTVIARASEGSRLEINAVGTGEAGNAARRRYTLRARQVNVAPSENGPIVHLETLSFQAQIPLPLADSNATTVGVGMPPVRGFSYTNVGVEADVDIRPGQRVVVGKSGVADPSKAMILVLSVRVEE